jgi:hypothetical protein
MTSLHPFLHDPFLLFLGLIYAGALIVWLLSMRG